MVRTLQQIAQSRVFLALALACGVTLSPTPARAEVYGSTSGSGALSFSDNVRFLQRSGGDDVRALSAQPSGALTATATRESAVRVPFQEELGLIQVRAQLNSRVETPFFVDTGTSDVMIPLRVARELGFCETCSNEQIPVMGISGIRMLPVMQVERLALGGAQVRSVRVIVNPDLQVGLLGRGFLKHFVYTVDDEARTLELRAR